MAEDRSPKSPKWKRVAEKTRERENNRERNEGGSVGITFVGATFRRSPD